MKVVTYNLDHYDPLELADWSYQYEDVDDRFALAEGVIRDLKPDILLVQEIFGKSQEEVAETTRHLAEQTRLRCELNGTVTAAKSSFHNLGTGILWHPDVQPLNWQLLDGFWHPCSILTVDINGAMVGHVCYHGQPVGRFSQGGDTRWQDMLHFADIAHENPYLLIGGDWNSCSAARQADGTYYDPDISPIALFSNGMTMEAVAYITSRMPAELLEDVGLVDIAAIRQPWTETKGHRPSKEGSQRLDRFYTTRAMLAAVLSFEVIRNEATLLASNHLPVAVTYAEH